MNAAALRMPLDKQLFFFPFLFVGFWRFTVFVSVPYPGAGRTLIGAHYGRIHVSPGSHEAGWLWMFAGGGLPDAEAADFTSHIVIPPRSPSQYGAFSYTMQKDPSTSTRIRRSAIVDSCCWNRYVDPTAIRGAVLQMVSHGLMTALFFAAIGMLYERTHTRKGRRTGRP